MFSHESQLLKLGYHSKFSLLELEQWSFSSDENLLAACSGNALCLWAVERESSAITLIFESRISLLMPAPTTWQKNTANFVVIADNGLYVIKKAVGEMSFSSHLLFHFPYYPDQAWLPICSQAKDKLIIAEIKKNNSFELCEIGQEGGKTCIYQAISCHKKELLHKIYWPSEQRLVTHLQNGQVFIYQLDTRVAQEWGVNINQIWHISSHDLLTTSFGKLSRSGYQQVPYHKTPIYGQEKYLVPGYVGTVLAITVGAEKNLMAYSQVWHHNIFFTTELDISKLKN